MIKLHRMKINLFYPAAIAAFAFLPAMRPETPTDAQPQAIEGQSSRGYDTRKPGFK